MWERLREQLMSAGLTLLCLAWFFGAVAIAMGPLGVEPQRGNLWVVMLIFLAPVFVMIAVEELVHRIRNGPQAPGRHSRDSASSQSDS